MKFAHCSLDKATRVWRSHLRRWERKTERFLRSLAPGWPRTARVRRARAVYARRRRGR